MERTVKAMTNINHTSNTCNLNPEMNSRLKLTLKLFAVISVIILIALIIPVLYVSQYAYPWADDFTYSWTVRAVFAATRNPIKAVLQALRCSADQFMNWQGTYTSCFLMAVQPAVFGTRCYHITAWLMLGSILISYFFLSYAVIVKKLRSNMSAAVILFAVTSAVTIENVKGQAEAFTWYNSAVHYTFNHALFILFLACMLMCRRKITKFLTMILGFLAAGGNNITVFGGLLFLALTELFLLFLAITDTISLSSGSSLQRNAALAGAEATGPRNRTSTKSGLKESTYYKKFICCLPFLIVFAAGALMNFAAPGNKVRLSGMGGRKEGIIATILTSFKLGAVNCVTWFNGTTLFLIAAAVIIAVIIFSHADKDVFGSFRFQFPWLVGIMSFCLFSALNAPIIYTSGSMVMQRVNNAIYYIYVLLIVLNCFWITGNLCLGRRTSDDFGKKKAFICAGVLMAAFITMLIWNLEIKKQNPTAFLTDSALYSIDNSGASFYGHVMQENTNRLKSDAPDVKVMRMGVDPSILYPHDAEDWINGTKLYYNKSSVEYE